MPGYAKHILKKYKEGGKVEEYKSDLMKEVEGMGPEGKRYLKDKLQGKKYEGELKDEFKEDLDKELDGMSEEGREELKKLLGLDDPFKKVREELDGEEETIGEKMAFSEEGYAKGGAVHHPVKAEPKDVLRTKKSSGMGGPVEHSKDKDWIQGAVKKPGALRAVAKKEGLIKGDEKLSGVDLKKLAAQAKKKKDKKLAQRVNLAETFAKMRKS
tara:strand:- start:663 stop:1301 length:639 start_codon:yes stop_codon:yes gene_type:complete